LDLLELLRDIKKTQFWRSLSSWKCLGYDEKNAKDCKLDSPSFSNYDSEKGRVINSNLKKIMMSQFATNDFRFD
jgi:hypothetical protein